jgi:hypothetical protein
MSFKSAKLLIATIGLGLGSAAIAEDLVYLYTEGSGMVWYYDAGTIRRYPNNVVEVWMAADASSDKTVSFRALRNKFRIDCSSETLGVLHVYHYRADGTSMKSQKFEYPQMMPFIPDTLSETMLIKMCA